MPVWIPIRGLVMMVVCLLTAACSPATGPVVAPSAAPSAPGSVASAPAASTAAPTPSTSATSSPTPSPPTPSAPTPSEPTPSEAAAPEPADEVRIDVTIADGLVRPSGQKIDVRQGQTVALQVTSDVDEEIHAHSAGDGYYFDVTAGEVSTGSFVAEDKGSFEVELHGSGDVLVILNVR